MNANFLKEKNIFQVFDDGRLQLQSLYMQMRHFQTYLLIYYDKSVIDLSNLFQLYLALI